MNLPVNSFVGQTLPGLLLLFLALPTAGGQVLCPSPAITLPILPKFSYCMKGGS
jgi:hypothetical protein